MELDLPPKREYKAGYGTRNTAQWEEFQKRDIYLIIITYCECHNEEHSKYIR